VRPASEVERRRLNDLFAELCSIPSPSGRERAVAERVAAELRALGFEVQEDDAAAATGGECGNLLARLPAGTARSERSVLLCAHLDTVPHPGTVEPVLVDGGWESAGDTILGADNKAAVAGLLALAHRVAVEGAPLGLELLFTVGEEVGLVGAKAFDVSRLRSELGYVFDHASPIGEVVVASPSYYRLQAHFHGAAAHAGIRPERGRSAIVAAARAVAAMRLGRLDEHTTANVGTIRGGDGATNVVPEHCSLLAEARSLDDATVEAVVAEMVDRCYDAANDPVCECDVDVDVERLFAAYRHGASDPAVVAAEAALSACGYVPSRIATGGGSDANAFEAAGLSCVNLANGTERNHETGERVGQAALEGMLDVTFALLDTLAEDARRSAA
jgi:tripeptide aminopeptidase